ncbi:MAG TPA: class I SAM-dependent methyltransferase [Candidatus Methylomirabilis sp.]|nr:class I SAM-dependent methyltransferase [Candidatus Methylomirabilis sp.]
MDSGQSGSQAGGVTRMVNRSSDYFDNQFRRQIAELDFALNPFKQLALEYLSGAVLDIGCGLGNLSLEAGRRGCRVVAVDGSVTAIARIRTAAMEEGLPVEAVQTDLTHYRIDRHYDAIVAIGLLMFFHKKRAMTLLEDIQAHVRPGGRAIVNVLVEGTTFLDMFEPGKFYLFGHDELESRCAAWTIILSRYESFPAPRNTAKEFTTLIAEKKAAG